MGQTAADRALEIAAQQRTARLNLGISDAVVALPQTKYLRKSDFCFPTVNFTEGMGEAGFVYIRSGATVAVLSSEQGHNGIVTIGTAAVETSRVVSTNTMTELMLGGSSVTYSALVRQNRVSNATDTFTTKCGLNSTTFVTTGEGMWFATDATNGGRFLCVCSDVNGTTTVDSGVAPTNGDWFLISITIDPNLAVTFSINGTVVAQINTNVTSVPLGVMAGGINRTAAPASALRTLDVDYCEVPVIPATQKVYRICHEGDSQLRGQGDPAVDGCRPRMWARAKSAGKFITHVGAFADGTSPTSSANGRRHGGVGGNLISDITARVAAEMISVHPDILVMLFGANNMTGGAGTAATAGADTTALINAIRAVMPTVKIIVGTPILTTDPTGATFQASVQTQVNASINALINAGDTNLRLVNTSAFVAADLADVNHPTVAGFIKLADIFWDGGLSSWIV